MLQLFSKLLVGHPCLVDQVIFQLLQPILFVVQAAVLVAKMVLKVCCGMDLEFFLINEDQLAVYMQ